MTEVTRILDALDSGDQDAAEQLLPLVYEELRRLARAKLSNEKSGNSLQATELVHEAYLRLVGDDAREKWNGRGHFFGAAAEAMRRILIENARRRHSLRWGGELHRIELTDNLCKTSARDQRLLALDDALQKLESVDPTKANLVRLRFFGGLTNELAASVLGISAATADRYWAYARVWLKRQISRDSKT